MSSVMSGESNTLSEDLERTRYKPLDNTTESHGHSWKRWVIILFVATILVSASIVSIYVLSKEARPHDSRPTSADDVEPIDIFDNLDSGLESVVKNNKYEGEGNFRGAADEFSGRATLPEPVTLLFNNSMHADPSKKKGMGWSDVVNAISNRPWLSTAAFVGVGLFAAVLIFVVIRFELPDTESVKVRKETDVVGAVNASTSRPLLLDD